MVGEIGASPGHSSVSHKSFFGFLQPACWVSGLPASFLKSPESNQADQRAKTALFEAADAPAEAVAGGAVDDGAAGSLEEVEEVDEELGQGFVFAGLAGEDEEEFTAVSAADGVENGVERPALVGEEGQADEVAAEGGEVGEEVGEGGSGGQMSREGEN